MVLYADSTIVQLTNLREKLHFPDEVCDQVVALVKEIGKINKVWHSIPVFVLICVVLLIAGFSETINGSCGY